MDSQSLHKSSLTSGSEKNTVVLERLDALDSPDNNNNNHTSASSSPKNERVASGLLKMLDDDCILDGLEDLPPSEALLDDDDDDDVDAELYQGMNGFHKINTNAQYHHHHHDYAKAIDSARPSDDASFIHSHSDLSDNEFESPLHFNNARQFELEFKLHEAEQKVEQLTLQLKGKSMQLEQVQVALISYEEEIMQLRQHVAPGSDSSENEEEQKAPAPVARSKLPATPTGSVSLETAEQLSSKIIKLQQRVEELEDIMVYTKLDNAQLKETTDFLKSKLKQLTKKSGDKKPPEKAPTSSSSVRNLFGRKQ